MATTATLTGGFEYISEPKSATIVKGYLYAYGDVIFGGFEYVQYRRPVTFLILD